VRINAGRRVILNAPRERVRGCGLGAAPSFTKGSSPTFWRKEKSGCESAEALKSGLTHVGRLFACVGGLEIAAGGVGLRLVAAACAGFLVLFDRFVAVVEEIEHLAGVELGAAANPVAAGGLSGGFDVAPGGVGDLVLAALGVGEAEVGHVEAGFVEVAGFLCVGEDGLVEGDGGGAVAFIFGEICLFEAEEEVAGILLGEAAFDGEGLGIAGVVAEEEREGSTGFDGGDDAVGCGFAEEVEAFLLVAGDAGDANHDAKKARQAGDGELLDADGHLGVGVAGVDSKGLLAVSS
jgi:hypothetical protein